MAASLWKARAWEEEEKADDYVEREHDAREALQREHVTLQNWPDAHPCIRP